MACVLRSRFAAPSFSTETGLIFLRRIAVGFPIELQSNWHPKCLRENDSSWRQVSTERKALWYANWVNSASQSETRQSGSETSASDAAAPDYEPRASIKPLSARDMLVTQRGMRPSAVSSRRRDQTYTQPMILNSRKREISASSYPISRMISSVCCPMSGAACLKTIGMSPKVQ